MKILKTTAFLVSFLIIGAGCSAATSPEQPKPTPADLLSPTAYTHSVYGFSVQPPKNWTTDEKTPNFALMVKSDHADAASEKFDYRANINFQVMKLKDGSVEETAKKYLATFDGDWKAVRIVEQGPTQISGNEAYRMVIDLDGEDFSPHGECLIIRADATEGLLACGYALQTTWSENKDAIEAALATIKP